MKTIGLARLGRDAEVRYTPGGDAVCNLSLAVNYGPKDQGGNRPTQWIDATLWGKRAEALAQFLVKGSVHCFTLEDIHIETYQKNGGGEGFKLAARVLDVELGPRVGGDQGSAPATRQPAAAPAQRPQPKPAPNFSDMDDDIPF
jgi:single-strand DNA-binding protein